MYKRLDIQIVRPPPRPVYEVLRYSAVLSDMTSVKINDEAHRIQLY